jgi:adenine-specific DNA-methyltransferase
VYSKNKPEFNINKLFDEGKIILSKNLDNDVRGVWKSVDYTCNKNRYERPNLYYPIAQPNTKNEILPKETAVWRFSKERHLENVANGLVYWGKDGKNLVPRYKKFETDAVPQGQVPISIWFHQEVGNTQDAKKEQNKLDAVDPFSTPKPERLLKRILEIATNPGDLVLDSFAGSGTTGAVAHKMGRRWIMIELGEHCHTHIIPRLKMVVDGEDQGGISKTVNWQGGGGFRYYSLAPSLLEQDRWGNWVVNKNYNPAMLAEALCKLEGFTSAPSDSQWWNHGYSSEQDFIYVTTQNLSHQQLEELSRCEWAHDDYSLNVANLPMAQPEPEVDKPKNVSLKQANTDQGDLFDEKA